jgi:hypothetical protein
MALQRHLLKVVQASYRQYRSEAESLIKLQISKVQQLKTQDTQNLATIDHL